MGQVFGLALDNEGDIFTTASSVYGNFNTGSTKSLLGGLVYRIDHLTGLVTPFITASSVPTYASGDQMPNMNGVGLGNIAFDAVHQQLLVTNFEDGKIYRLKGVSNPTGTIAAPPYGPFDHPCLIGAAPDSCGKGDEGTAGFADAGFLGAGTITQPCTAANPQCNWSRRLWAISVQVQGTSVRVYFSVWAQDQYRSSGARLSSTAPVNTRNTPNKIWSVALTATGDFDPTTLRDETTNSASPLAIPFLTTPHSPSTGVGSLAGSNSPGWTNPISDIQFSSTGNMLVAERTWWAPFNGDYGSLSGTWPSGVNHFAAHNSRVFEFIPNGSGGWKQQAPNQQNQYYTGSIISGANSAGGADYGYDDYPERCEQRIWMTGDYLTTLNSNPMDIIYGLQTTATGAYRNGSLDNTDDFADLNNIFAFPGTFDKTTIGDVVVYRDPCSRSFIEVCKSSSSDKNSVTGNFTFTATNAATNGMFFTTDPLVVPVGYCTGPIPVPAGTVVVTETPKPGVRVNSIVVSGSLENSSSSDPSRGAATLMVAPVVDGAPSTETVVDFANELTGQLKICKIAGAGVQVGTPFTFTATGSSQSITVPAGPASQGGYCFVDHTTFPVGSSATVTELPSRAFTITGIMVNVNGTQIASPSITSGSVPVTIAPGFTEVTFINGATSCPQCTAGELGISNYSFVGQQAAAEGHTYITYRADLLNTGAARGAMTATLTSMDPGVQVVSGQGTLNFVTAPTNSQVTSSNTFTIMTDPGVPFDFSNLKWTFQAGRRHLLRP